METIILFSMNRCKSLNSSLLHKWIQMSEDQVDSIHKTWWPQTTVYKIIEKLKEVYNYWRKECQVEIKPVKIRLMLDNQNQQETDFSRITNMCQSRLDKTSNCLMQIHKSNNWIITIAKYLNQRSLDKINTNQKKFLDKM